MSLQMKMFLTRVLPCVPFICRQPKNVSFIRFNLERIHVHNNILCTHETAALVNKLPSFYNFQRFLSPVYLLHDSYSPGKGSLDLGL